MFIDIKNKNIYQWKYRLYVISGFNFLLKKTKILSYILIHNVTFSSYNEIFKNLMNEFEY